MVKYILMPEEAIQKIRKGDKFFVDGEFNPNAARIITAAHDAYFWVDDNNMPHWTVDAEGGRMLWIWRNLPAGLSFLIQPEILAVFFFCKNGELAY